jgi:hypothetical protein
MKSKKNSYFLVPAVLIIWGLIGYRIYKGFSTPKTTVNAITTTADFKPVKINSSKPYEINANYRDPFLGTLASNLKKRTTNAKPNEQIAFPKIVFKGIVSPKTKNKSAVYLVQINGQQNLLKLNNTTQEVKLISGNDTKIVLEYKKARQSFLIQ